MKHPNNLKALRLALGATQKNVWERAGVGSGSYQQLEWGTRAPSLDSAHRLVVTLQVDAVDDIWPNPYKEKS